MRTSFFLFLILFFFVVSSCTDDINPIVELNSDSSITTFSFLKSDNPSLSSDILLEIVDNKIKGKVPVEVSLDSLVATFEFIGKEVKIEEKVQESGTTINSFKEILIFSSVAEDGTAHDYEVDIIRFTGLPLVFITTDNSALIDSKEEYREGNVEIIGSRGFENLNLSMKIRGRGNSTWGLGHFGKKPYQLKLDDKSSFLGMPKAKKWIFLAEYSDKTMLRNKVGFELGCLSDLDWTPSSVFAEVFVNGEYKGTYHIAQKVEESKSRVNIGDNGYLLEIDQLHRLDDDDVYFETSKFLMNIKEPKVEKDDEAYEYITSFMADFESALYGDDFKDPTSGYAKYIDVNSFIDWYLINEIAKNNDAQSFSSIYLNMIPGEKLKMGPLWDFDLGFGNVNYSDCEFTSGFWIRKNAWLKRMFKDPLFVEKVRKRFIFYRDNKNYIMDKIDETAIKLYNAQYENDQVYHTLGNYVWPNPVWFDTYEEEVERLKEWISDRIDWIESAFANL